MQLESGTVISDAGEVAGMISSLAQAVAQRHPQVGEVALVGIRTGGAHLAWRLGRALEELSGAAPFIGVMDITLYRDDWTRLHSRPKMGPTEIDFVIDGRDVILVDDVLYTGRTIRAALDALIDLGRPRRIELAVLIDRGHRELPIQADYVGRTVETSAREVIDVALTEEGFEGDAVILRTRE